MKRFLTIIFILTCVSGYCQQPINIVGPDTLFNKFPGHLWRSRPLVVTTPLYNPCDTCIAIDPTYYYKKADADSALQSKATLNGTVGYIQMMDSTGRIANSKGIDDSTSTAFSGSFLVGQGANLVLNPYFSTTASWFQQFSYWTISDGGATTSGANANQSIYQPSSIGVGVDVVVEYDITAYNSGAIRSVIIGSVGKINSGVGHYVDFLTTSDTTTALQNFNLRPQGSFDGTIDNFTVRRVVDGDGIFANKVLAETVEIKDGTASQHLMGDGTTSPLLTLTTTGTGDATLNTSTRVLNIPSNSAYLTSANYVVREAPTGTINGVNVTFTLANTPVTGKEMVYMNGLLQDSTDYSISGATITYLVAPPTGTKLVVTYLK